MREVDLERHTRPRVLALFRPLDVTFSKAADVRAAGVNGRGRSFPSGHVMDNVCVAVVLSLFYRRRGWLYFLVAALVGYSRIYTGAHWPSDVLLTGCLGVAFALGIVAAARWIFWRTRWAARWDAAVLLGA